MAIEADFPWLAITHPAHLEYMRSPLLNTMPYFLETLDKLDSERRHEIMYGAFWAVIESIETVQGVERKTDKADVSYDAFKRVCKSLPWGVGTLLIISAVHLTLSTLLSISDTTSVDDDKSRLIEFAEHVMRNPPPPDKTAEDEGFKNWLVGHIENLDETKLAHYNDYVYFCENVVRRLLEENPFANRAE
jgi:hypothetical protein